jgi:hypothetical protein
MERLGSDPMFSVLEQKPDLGEILRRLAREMGTGATT